MPPGDEGLVNLVRDRVGRREEKRGGSTACGAIEERAEERVLRCVGDLPQDGVPGAEAGATTQAKAGAAVLITTDCGATVVTPKTSVDAGETAMRSLDRVADIESVVPRRGDGPKRRTSRCIWQFLPP